MATDRCVVRAKDAPTLSDREALARIAARPISRRLAWQTGAGTPEPDRRGGAR